MSHQDCPNGNQINYIDVLRKFATFTIILLVVQGFKSWGRPILPPGLLVEALPWWPGPARWIWVPVRWWQGRILQRRLGMFANAYH